MGQFDIRSNTIAMAYWKRYGVTIACLYYEGELYLGAALKNPSDPWCKTIGKFLAKERALKLIYDEQEHNTKFRFHWKDAPHLWMKAIRSSILRKMRTYDGGLNRSSKVDAWVPDHDDGLKLMNCVRQAIIRAGHKELVPTLEDIRPNRARREKEILDELNHELESEKDSSFKIDCTYFNQDTNNCTIKTKGRLNFCRQCPLCET